MMKYDQRIDEHFCTMNIPCISKTKTQENDINLPNIKTKQKL